MPRKKLQPSTLSQAKLKKKAKWGGYVRCDLDTHERKACSEWVDEQGPALHEHLGKFIENGFTLSMIQDEDTGSVSARAFWVDPPSRKSYMLTAFADTWQMALMVLFFKHFVILEGDWSVGLEENISALPFG